MTFHETMERLAAMPRARACVIRVARAYLRYSPLRAGKWELWDRVIEPYFAWESHPFVARTCFGAVLAGNTQDYVQQLIYFFGMWEPTITRWIGRRLRPGEVFVDIGANIGYYAALAARSVGKTGRVIAIEASPAMYQELTENLARNRCSNVRAVHQAVAGVRGTLAIYRGGHHNLGESTAVAGQGFELECEVDAAPLNEILHSDELACARLIKMDIEGGELVAIEALAEWLPSAPDAIEWIVEFHPQLLSAQGRNSAELIEIFLRAGFHVYRLENDSWAHTCLPPFAEPYAERFTGDVSEEMNLVFSRKDAERI